MRKLNYLLAISFMIAILASCEKRNVEVRNYEAAYTGEAILLPIVSGNTSCDELVGDFTGTTGKVDYVNGTFVFDDANISSWEEMGLSVTVSEDGRAVSFTSSLYCVGAVIVKGGNASNVYTYDSGAQSDVNLTAPINSSGYPAALSNLTFCFTECAEEPIYVAVKLAYWYAPSYIPDAWGGSWGWALSAGDFKLDYSGWDWCRGLGIIEYPTKTSASLIASNTNEDIGTVTIEPDGTDMIKVTVVLKDDALMDKIYVYAGDKAGIGLDAPVTSCPVYTSWPWSDEENKYSYSFSIPY